MTNPLRSELSTSLGLLAARLPLGTLFVLSAISKFRLSGGVGEYVTTTISMVPSYVPPDAGEKFLTAVPYAQLGFGILIIAGLLTRVSAFGSALISIAFGLVLGFINVRETDPMEVVTHPTVLLCLSLVAFFAGPGLFSVDRLLFGRQSDRKID